MDNLDYIESYFKNELVSGQAKEFEKRIETDPAFAEEVAFYLSAMNISGETFRTEKKQQFKEFYQKSDSGTETSNIPVLGRSHRITPVRKLVYFLAAAAAITGIVFGTYTFMKPVPLQQLADQYIKENLQTLSVTMSSHADSLQIGLRLYNEGKTSDALQVFENITKSDTSLFNAKKYAGITALRLKDYDKALFYFEQMEIYTGRYSNPSLFYQALTHMERNQPGDAAKAKELMQKVVTNKLEGSESAAEWLHKI